MSQEMGGFNMDIREFQMFEKAVNDFLLKLKRRKQIKIQYYFFKSRIMGYDFSFVGYRTKDGLHGIHYCRQKNAYYFGGQSLKMKPTLQHIPQGISYNFPGKLKEAFLKVSETKTNCIISR